MSTDLLEHLSSPAKHTD